MSGSIGRASICCAGGEWRRYNGQEKQPNEQVLDRIAEKRTLLNNILRRKANLIGHILAEVASFMMPLKDR